MLGIVYKIVKRCFEVVDDIFFFKEGFTFFVRQLVGNRLLTTEQD